MSMAPWYQDRIDEAIARVEQIRAKLINAEAALDQARNPLTWGIGWGNGDLQLSMRATNCLHNGGLWTVQDLVRCTPCTLLRIKNLGRGTIKEIARELDSVGLALQECGHSSGPCPYLPGELRALTQDAQEAAQGGTGATSSEKRFCGKG